MLASTIVCMNMIFSMLALLAPKHLNSAAVSWLRATNGALASNMATTDNTTLTMAAKPKKVSALSSALLISGRAVFTSSIRSPRCSVGVSSAVICLTWLALPATNN